MYESTDALNKLILDFAMLIQTNDTIYGPDMQHDVTITGEQLRLTHQFLSFLGQLTKENKELWVT